MNIFVTGATGFVGRHFLDRLLAACGPDDTVYTLARREAAWDDPRVVPVRGSLEAIADHRDVLLASDYVFHLAANADFASTGVHEALTLRPMQAMVEMLADSRVLKNFVFTSTIGAVDRAAGDPCRAPLSLTSEPNPRSEYGLYKLRAEACLRQSGLPHTILRLTWVYGAHMRAQSHINAFATMVADSALPVRFPFPGRVSLIHVQDVADALVACLGNTQILHQTYFAVTENLSLDGIFTILRTQLEATTRRLPLPPLTWLLRRLHHRLPVAVNNLYLDYLCAEDPEFVRDFSLAQPRAFAAHVADVLATNTRASGVTVITGANSGIGLALAHRWAHRSLVLVDKCTDQVRDFAGQTVVEVDLTDPSAPLQIAQAVGERPIACLVNNAGVGYRGALPELTPAQIVRTIATNVTATVLLTKALLPNLMASRGTIVNVASSVAYNPLPYMSVYAASKAFVVHWSDALAHELRHTNRVITFSPSGTNTNFQAAAGVRTDDADNTLLTPNYVAARIDAAVHGRRTQVVLGWKTKIMLLVSKFLPRRMNVRMWGMAFEKMR